MDPYRVLEINSDASETEVKKAYKILALKYHPDRCPKELKSIYEEKFKEINAAYKEIIESKSYIFRKKNSININLEEVDVENQSGSKFDIYLPVLGFCFKVGYLTGLFFTVGIRFLLIIAAHYSNIHPIIDFCYWFVPIAILVYIYLALKKCYDLTTTLFFALLTIMIFEAIIHFIGVNRL